MEELILGDNSCAHWGNLSESVVPDLEKQISSGTLPGGSKICKQLQGKKFERVSRKFINSYAIIMNKFF